MDKRLLIIVTGVLLVFVGLIAFGQVTIDFDPTTYNPAAREKVTFSLCQGCAVGGTRYEWDFDGDGKVDVTTANPFVDHAYAAPGYMKVTLKAVGPAGRVMARRKGLLVGKTSLIGIRYVERQSDGSIIVTITIIPSGNLVGVGVEELIPIGWQVGSSQGGDVPIKRMGRKLQVLWLQLTSGNTVSFSYQLYPTQGNGVPAFSGTVSGYEDGKRVTSEICGDLALPY